VIIAQHTNTVILVTACDHCTTH